jgi:histidyl-tRNA synthetase
MPKGFARINREKYNWLEGYTKKIEQKHHGVTFGYETEDNTWRIFSKNGTLLIKIGFDLDNKYIVYEYLTKTGGKLSLRPERTKSLIDLKSLLPRLEEINAFDK